MNRIAATFLLTLALSAVAYSQTTATKSDGKETTQDEAAIRAIVQSVQDAWNTHDGKAFAAPFTADADYVVVNGLYIKGRDAIEKGHMQIFSTIYKDSRNAATVKSVRFIRPDVAVAHIEWNLEYNVGGEARKGHAINTMVMTKEGGKWSIAAFQNTPVQPQGGVPPQSQPRP
ncbi:MAG TPA: SgcJ/EcaC family oxidoreductase [Pyrinomonadaceae bacterium]|nr:SgcJ/EcaC family oxidoreductase [Pyrinomonadaceae bacterium]